MKGVRGIFTERDIPGKEKGYGNKKKDCLLAQQS